MYNRIKIESSDTAKVFYFNSLIMFADI